MSTLANAIVFLPRMVNTCDKRKVGANKSLEAYKAASDVAVTELLHLGLALNIFVFYYDRPTGDRRLASKLSTTPSPSSTSRQKRDTKIRL
jgi:hypothetical protein